MLFLASRILEHEADEETRLLLLEKLQAENLMPLIRSTRLECYRQALANSEQVHEMERAIATSTRLENKTAYVRGDIFCLDDHVFFLVFGDRESTSKGIHAGIIYEQQTTQPLRKLDSFCQKLSEHFMTDDESRASREEGVQSLEKWQPWQHRARRGFTRFVARQDVDVLYTVVRKETSKERVRAAELLESAHTRTFLRKARVAYAEGYAARMLAGDAGGAAADFSLDKLVAVGLLRREVLISCRKTGHTLLSLPSPDALAVITISDATCSECGERIANEKVEEVVAPTHLAAALLDDAAWLVNRFHSILRSLGIPESEIAIEPPSGDGEAYMMSDVCGEPFLFVLRDGELTPAFARRAVDMQMETEANHLIVVATGAVHNEARNYLLNYAHRIVRGGKELELMMLDGGGASTPELKRSFERVSQKVMAEQLCELDTSLGFSVARLVTARFELLHDSTADASSAQLLAIAPHAGSSQPDESRLPFIALTFPLMQDEDETHNLSTTQLSHETG